MSGRYATILCILVVSIFFGSMLAVGEEGPSSDEVRVTDKGSGGHETDVAYQGDQWMHLYVKFGQDCSNYTIDLKSPLFLTHIRGLNPRTIETGKVITYGLELDPQAAPGIYNFTAYFNYTTAGGEDVNSSYDFSLTLLQTWKVLDVHVPDGGDYRLSVTFETFLRFHNVTVLFGGDGNVGVEDERIVLEDLEPGEHTVKTKVIRVDSMAGNAQEVSWDLTGVVENRTLWKSEYNIPVDVSWGIPGFDAPLLLLATVGALATTRLKREWRSSVKPPA